MHRSLPALIAAAAVTAGLLLPCGSALAKGGPEPVAVDAAFKPAEMAAKVLTVLEPQALKGITRVAVPLFSVEFVVSDNQSAETSGFGSAGRASVSAYYQLVGAGQPEFQAITDALHAAFLRDLRAAGFEVVAWDAVAAAPTYRKLAAGGTPSPIQGDSSVVVAPAGMPIYGLAKAPTSNSGGGVFGAIAGFGAVASAIGAAVDTGELQKELGAAVLEVQMRVNFVQMTNDNRGFLGRLSNTASVSSKVSPRITTASLGVQSASRSTMTLANPLVLDGAAFSEVRKAPTTTGDVAGSVLAGVIRMASGSKDSHSTERMEAVADPVRYREVVGGGLTAVNQMFIQRLRAGE